MHACWLEGGKGEEGIRKSYRIFAQTHRSFLVRKAQYTEDHLEEEISYQAYNQKPDQLVGKDFFETRPAQRIICIPFIWENESHAPGIYADDTPFLWSPRMPG